MKEFSLFDLLFRAATVNLTFAFESIKEKQYDVAVLHLDSSIEKMKDGEEKRNARLLRSICKFILGDYHSALKDAEECMRHSLHMECSSIVSSLLLSSKCYGRLGDETKKKAWADAILKYSLFHKSIAPQPESQSEEQAVRSYCIGIECKVK